MRSLVSKMAKSFHRNAKLPAGFLLAAITCIAYVNSLPNGFHFDDYHAIVQNPAIRDLSHIPSYFTDPSTWTMTSRRDWRPIVQTSYALNYFIGGLNPAYFRLFNLFFHIATAFLVLLIFAETFRISSTDRALPSSRSVGWLALFSAGLFAVHTVNTEAVNYIWVRSSLLASFFYLLAFYCFLRGPFSRREKTFGWWHAAGVTAFSLGLGSKAIAITLPLALVFYEIFFLNPDWRNPFGLYRREPWRLKKYVPLALVCLAYIALRFLLLPRSMTILVTARDVTPFVYQWTQFRAWVYYLRLFLWPDPLIVDYPGFGWSRSLWDYRVLLSIGVVALLWSAAWRLRKTEPVMAFFTFWFFIALLPEASILPLSDPVNGYRPYLANAGLAIVAAVGLFKAAERVSRKIGRAGFVFATIIGGLIILSLTLATVKRNRVWRNEFTLWSDVLRKDPTNPRAYMNLGLALLKDGNYPEAQELFEKAVRLGPGNPFGYILRGYFNSLFDRSTKALEDFTQAIRLAPRLPYGFFYRGEVYRKMGEYEKALTDYRSAVQLRPLYTEAHLGMASAFQLQGESGKAMEACKTVIGIDPHDPRGFSCLGRLLAGQNRFSEARDTYRIGVSRAPEDSELWYQLGLAYEKLGMYPQAADAFGKAGSLIGSGLTPKATSSN